MIKIKNNSKYTKYHDIYLELFSGEYILWENMIIRKDIV